MKTEERDRYVISFDFDIEILMQFKGKNPDQAAELFI